MCRLACYKGKSLPLGEVISNPQNSLVFQSRQAHYHPMVTDSTHERNILVNGDGFGLSWYSEIGNAKSCCFKFITPAWSNSNLKNIGEHVKSHLFLAHVRAASSGHNAEEKTYISVENCHPFKFGPYTFMHNGAIPEFSKIKLAILNILADKGLHVGISGNTDSEHIFGLFLYNLKALEGSETATLADMTASLQTTISIILELVKKYNAKNPTCSLNMVVSNGMHVLATRFRNSDDSDVAPSLYYNYGSDFKCHNGCFYSSGDPAIARDIIISSAPLSICGAESTVSSDCTSKKGLQPGLSTNVNCPSSIGKWVLIPNNHMLVCEGEANSVHCKSVKLIAIANPVSQIDDRDTMQRKRSKSLFDVPMNLSFPPNANRSRNTTLYSEGESPSNDPHATLQQLKKKVYGKGSNLSLESLQYDRETDDLLPKPCCDQDGSVNIPAGAGGGGVSSVNISSSVDISPNGDKSPSNSIWDQRISLTIRQLGELITAVALITLIFTLVSVYAVLKMKGGVIESVD